MSKYIYTNNLKRKSKLITAIDMALDAGKINEPKGLWDISTKVTIKSKSSTLKFNSDELDIEYTINFDDDMVANEAEIVVYNLKKTTRNSIKRNSKISVKTGYSGDTGVIFNGYVRKVTTEIEEADLKTTIKCLDYIKKKKVNKTFKKGTKASTILKWLIKQTGKPIAKFKIAKEHTYKDSVKLDGQLTENILDYSKVCRVSTFVSNDEIYCKPLNVGKDIKFTISENTGLISCQEFEEEESTDSGNYTVKGYEVQTLLQYRYHAGAIVTLKSEFANGKYRIKSGEHCFNDTESYSTIKVVKK